MGQTVGNAARRWLNVMVVVLCPPLWLYAGYKLTRHPIDIHGRGFLKKQLQKRETGGITRKNREDGALYLSAFT